MSEIPFTAEAQPPGSFVFDDVSLPIRNDFAVENSSATPNTALEVRPETSPFHAAVEDFRSIMLSMDAVIETVDWSPERTGIIHIPEYEPALSCARLVLSALQDESAPAYVTEYSDEADGESFNAVYVNDGDPQAFREVYGSFKLTNPFHAVLNMQTDPVMGPGVYRHPFYKDFTRGLLREGITQETADRLYIEASMTNLATHWLQETARKTPEIKDYFGDDITARIDTFNTRYEQGYRPLGAEAMHGLAARAVRWAKDGPAPRPEI